MASRALVRLRKLCLALEGTTEKVSWGTQTFRSPRRIYAMFASKDTHTGNGRDAVWVMAADGRQERMIRTDPKRFFRPPYVGPDGWIGAWLDVADWDELVLILAAGKALAQGAGASFGTRSRAKRKAGKTAIT